jgi:hypothetical protein
LPLLSLLATPLLAASEPAAPVIRAGSLKIIVDPTAASVLPVDSTALRKLLCSGVPSGWLPLSASGECDLAVYPKSLPPPGLDLDVGEIKAADGHLRIAVQPTGWEPWRASAPLATECGLWDIAVDLDPLKPQPVSALALEPSVADPNQGVFAGAVQLAALYRFTRLDPADSIELPAKLSLELSGHWAAVPEGGPSLGEGASNLVLFAGTFGDQWFAAPACVTWGGLPCEVCLAPPMEVLETLGSGFQPLAVCR